MKLWFNHGLMNANMFDVMYIYIGMKYMEIICLHGMLT